jgi:hypothetical protein
MASNYHRNGWVLFESTLCNKLHSFNDMPSQIAFDTKNFTAETSLFFCYHDNNMLHRDHDKPAIIEVEIDNECYSLITAMIDTYNINDNKPVELLDFLISILKTYKVVYEFWWYKDERHRDNGYAVINHVTGSTYYWRFNKQHREHDLPAIISYTAPESLYQAWYIDDRLHREHDLPAVIDDYVQEWYQNGVRYRQNEEKPAVIKQNGCMKWYNKEGRLHRVGYPAIISENARPNKYCEEWYINGKPHRGNDLPARKKKNGTQEWWFNGYLHRDNDKPAIITADNQYLYYKNGKQYSLIEEIVDDKGVISWLYKGVLHNDRRPAVIYPNGRLEYYNYGNFHSYNNKPAIITENNDKYWYKHGVLHRDSGPAVIMKSGLKLWYNEGMQIIKN